MTMTTGSQLILDHHSVMCYTKCAWRIQQVLVYMWKALKQHRIHLSRCHPNLVNSTASEISAVIPEKAIMNTDRQRTTIVNYTREANKLKVF